MDSGFVSSPLGKESLEAGAFAEVADVGLSVRQVSAILPNSDRGHHRGLARFDLGGIEILDFHDLTSISKRRVGKLRFVVSHPFRDETAEWMGHPASVQSPTFDSWALFSVG